MEEIWHLLEQYGLWALAVGAFFQGYSLVILAGLFVSQRHLDGVDVWIVSAISAWIGHWFFFGLGRWLGRKRHVIQSKNINNKLNYLNDTIDLHPWFSMFFTQYGYGVRIVGAVAFGLSRVRRRWFAFAQGINCAIWAAILFAIGYSTGSGFKFLPDYMVKPLVMASTLSIIYFLYLKKRRGFTPDKLPARSVKETYK